MQLTYQKFRPMKGKVFVTDLERGMAVTAGGIILKDDNMTNKGIKARWCKVALIGECDPTEIDGVKVGDWVLVEHGRWTFGMDFVDEDTGKKVTIWHIETKAMMVACDEDPRLQSF